MAGHSRSKNGVAEPVIGPRYARTRWLACDPVIHVLGPAPKTWMPAIGAQLSGLALT
jgi:hypothetical protein